MPFLSDEHKGHCPKCGTVTYVSMEETVTHEFTSWFKTELDAEFSKATQIVLDNSYTPDVEPWNVIPDAWQIEAEALAADAEDWMQQTVELRNQ